MPEVFIAFSDRRPTYSDILVEDVVSKASAKVRKKQPESRPRSPLDPTLAGLMAEAWVNGVQSQKVMTSEQSHIRRIESH